MKKTSSNGFVLLETLVVTVFISGVLIFLFSQFATLNNNYEKSYNYNSVDDIYALYNITSYIKSDEDGIMNKISTDLNDYIDITDCSLFTNVNFCKKILDYEEIDSIFVLKNKFDKTYIIDFDEDLKEFINQISPKGEEQYRLIARFKHKLVKKVLNVGNNTYEDKEFFHNTFATVRFGDTNE